MNKKILIITVALAVLMLLSLPVSAAEPNSDPIVGTWDGSASFWFFASGSGSVTFNNDSTASAVGTVTVFGNTKTYNFPKLIWENDGNNQYTGSYGDRELKFTLNRDGTITAKFNPYKLRGTDISLFNIDIPIKLTRV